MNFISMNLVTLMYLIASVCFIQALKGLSSPATARTGALRRSTDRIRAINSRNSQGFAM